MSFAAVQQRVAVPMSRGFQSLPPAWCMLTPEVSMLLALMMACKGGDAPTDDSGPGVPSSLYDPSVTTVLLEVDYTPGAEPYDDEVRSGEPLWRFFADNAEAALGNTRRVDAPFSLAEMQALPDPGDELFNLDDILGLAATYRDEYPAGDTFTFYAIWLDGHFEDADGVEQDSVLGVSIGDTGVIGMFKPVIEGASGLGPVQRFVEQTTLVHEFGHAIGLVNNGAPPQQSHEDPEHRAHCDNEDCVMYWANEGASDVVAFVADLLTGGDNVVYDDRCVEDVRAALP